MYKLNTKPIVSSLGILAVLALGVITIPLQANADRSGYVTPYNSTRFNNNVSSNNQYNTYQEPSNSINPLPVVDSISPSSSYVGVGTKTITITGSGFIPSSIARINGSNRSTTFIDNSHLLMQITGNDTYTYFSNGGFYVSVFNGLPGGGYSNTAFFTINKTAVSSTATTTAKKANDTSSNFLDITGNGNGANPDQGNLAANAIFGSNSFMPSGIIQWILLTILILLLVILVRRIYGADKKYHATPMKHD